MSGNETYDVSPTQRKILEARAARRTVLRHEYLKQIGNPYRYGIGEAGNVFDEGLQRFMSMRVTAHHFFRPSPRNALLYFGGVITPIFLISYVVIRAKDKEEATYRAGKVSYRDREFKFT